MSRNIIIVLAALCFLLVTCKQFNKKDAISNNVNQSDQFKEGLSILNQNCTSCHSPKANINNAIGPTLIEIKEQYLNKTEGQIEFVNSMTAFLLSPNMGNAKMPEQIKKFGLMPNLGYSKDQYEAVASFIYQADMSNPNWLESQSQTDEESANNAEEPIDYLKKGQQIAMSTKSVLGSNLLKAIQEKGVHNALEFCNAKAIPLTDSMSRALNANIKRVSDNNRNPNNAANEMELEYINAAKLAIQETGAADPKIYEHDSKMIGYYPIITNDMCLKCHGQEETDIDAKTLTTIHELYPQDKGTGYAANQLRGIWVIEMSK